VDKGESILCARILWTTPEAICFSNIQALPVYMKKNGCKNKFTLLLGIKKNASRKMELTDKLKSIF